MRRIAISLSKGGVAKSTSSVSIAHGLSLKGMKVLLVDTDDQGQDAFLLGSTPKYGLADVITNGISLDKAMHEARKNLWVLAGGKSLSGVKREIGRKEFGAEQTLAESLASIQGKFDFVIIDTSPSWDTLTINALFYATEVITPVSLEILTLNSLIEFSNSLIAVQKFNKKLSHRYILPTFLDGRVKKSKEILKQLEKHYPEKVCEPIKYSVRISESAGFGQTIYEYAPSSSGVKDYEKLVQRILKDG
jgi:chromosome partitioning protein